MHLGHLKKFKMAAKIDGSAGQNMETSAFCATMGRSANKKMSVPNIFTMTTYKPKLPTNISSLNWVGPDAPAYAQSGLIHCVSLPENAGPSQPAPLVVMVHGWGGDESVMWIFKQTLPAGVAAITPRAPVALENNQGFIWFTYPHTRLNPDPDSLERGLANLGRFIASLPQLYPVDPRRIILMGFSQGAAMCNAYILTHPQAAIGVASLAGSLVNIPNFESHPQLLAGLPVFIAHGARDEVVPIGEAQESRQIFANAGADVTYGEYNTGHKMSSQAMKDLSVWLSNLLTKA